RPHDAQLVLLHGGPEVEAAGPSWHVVNHLEAGLAEPDVAQSGAALDTRDGTQRRRWRRDAAWCSASLQRRTLLDQEVSEPGHAALGQVGRGLCMDDLSVGDILPLAHQ